MVIWDQGESHADPSLRKLWVPAKILIVIKSHLADLTDSTSMTIAGN
jgi:hypothetical protein